MECGDSTNIDSILSPLPELKSETLADSNFCNDDIITEKDLDDLTGPVNIDALTSCVDQASFNPTALEGLDANIFENIDDNYVNSEIPPIENVDAVLPMYGPFPEFESPAAFEADVIDPQAIPGVCGLRNLGNTCFMNAGLQCLLNNKVFKNYFCDRDLDCFIKGTLTEMFAEILKKFWSGSYSTLHLGEFKECFGAMHAQFRNFRQHDCQEFLALLLDTMHEELNVARKEVKSNNNQSNTDFLKSKSFETDADCDKNMEVCEKEIKSEKTFISSSPETSEQSLSDSGSTTSEAPHIESTANNTKELNKVFEMLGYMRCKRGTDALDDSSSVQSENNSEKISDLTINNKLDKILNKNDLDIICNSNDNAYIKTKTVEEHNILQANILEKNELACQFNTARKIPSISDFVKDTKTLNTNVLVPDETNNLLKFDSEKFPKHEPNRLQETVDNLGQIVDFGVKQGGVKRVKMTNIVHEKQKMLENNCEASSCSGLHKRMKMDSIENSLDSTTNEQDDEVPMESGPCDEYSEGSSQSSEMYSLNTDCHRLIVADELRRAYNHWDQYKMLNQSIISDSFHGQFRSSVVCSQCSHNSVTYEPFMYLPVFLPHALEKQIVVTFVQNNGSSPVCYLVNVNKYDRIHKIREALQRFADVAPEEIILAEVLDHRISRTLDETMVIRRINDSSRSVYAFEVGKMCEENSDSCKNSNTIPLPYEAIPDLNNYSSNSLFSNSKTNIGISESSDYYDTSSSSNNKQSDVNSFTKFDMGLSSNVQDNAALNFSGSVHRSCAICLEDFPDYDLSLHPNCDCILCTTCIDVSCKHYGGSGSFLCPVCSETVTPADDFVPLTRIGEYQFKINTIPVPVLLRHDTFENGLLKEKVLIGHPGLLKLPSTLPAVKLYEHVDNAIPFLSTYSLLLVDTSGKNCSRCLYTEQCSGCEIARLGDIKLRSGDNIVVRYTDLPPECIASADVVIQHKSMQQARHKSELDIYDCLEYFSERESLDEDSPWFCPVCRRNQQATKSLSVWKFPEILIICLKRFVFHEFVSIKVEEKVSYPIEGLDLSTFSTGPFTGELIYDLQACVCHFGGVSAGHYTSYSKHAVTNEWYNQNDENVKKESPNTDGSVSEYILFYQKR